MSNDLCAFMLVDQAGCIVNLIKHKLRISTWLLYWYALNLIWTIKESSEAVNFCNTMLTSQEVHWQGNINKKWIKNKPASLHWQPFCTVMMNVLFGYNRWKCPQMWSIPCKKVRVLYLSVNLFSMQLLIDETIFKYPTLRWDCSFYMVIKYMLLHNYTCALINCSLNRLNLT